MKPGDPFYDERWDFERCRPPAGSISDVVAGLGYRELRDIAIKASVRSPETFERWLREISDQRRQDAEWSRS